MQLAACSAPADSGSDLNQELCRCSEAFPCVLGRLALPSSQWLLQTVFILPKLLSPDFPLILSRALCLPFNEQSRSPGANHFIPPSSQTISICPTRSFFLSVPEDKGSLLLAKAKLGIPSPYSFRIPCSLLHLPPREPPYALLALSIGILRLLTPTATFTCFSSEPRKSSPHPLLSFLTSNLFSSPPQLRFCRLPHYHHRHC